MKLELTPDLIEMLREAWLANGSAMADGQRPIENLERLLYEQPYVIWLQGPGRSWIYLTEVTPGQNANMHALNLDGWAAVDVPLVRKTLAGAMQEYNLHRLSIALPTPLDQIARAAKMLGFRKEGTLREACIFNQQHVDVDIYGLLRSESLSALPTKRRRRRSRRKKWKTTAQAV